MNYIYLGTLCFVGGCYAGLESASAVAAAAASVLAAAAARCFYRAEKDRCFHYLVLLVFLLLGLISAWRAAEPPQKELEPYFDRQVLLTGRIDLLSVKQYEYGCSFILECRQLETDHERVSCQQKVRVFTGESLPDLPAGVVSCSGKLEPLRSFRNPGGFDGENWNRVHGIGGSIRKASVVFLQHDWRLADRLAAVNIRLRQHLAETAGEQAPLLAGMVLGGSASVDEESKRLFTYNGLSHLLSVSGSHLVLLSGFLLLLFGSVPERVRSLLIACCLTSYAAVCGWQAPVVRALLMSLVLLYGGKGAAKGNLLCLTAVVMLIFKPLWLLDVGFLLSFGAAGGLIWLQPVIQKKLSCFLPLWISEMAAVTLAAQLPVLPFLAGWFHQLSLISLISNIVLTPVLEVCVVLTLLGLALDTLFSWGSLFIEAAAFLLRQLLIQAELLASVPLGRLVMGRLPQWSVVVYYFLLLLALDLPCVQFLRNKERRLLLGVLLAAFAGALLWSRYAPQPLTVYFLDVGQGDSTVIVTPSGRTVVIDTGGLRGFDTGSRIVAPFLRSIGRDRVDVLLLSHSDFDHAGGAAGLAADIAVDAFIVPPDMEPAALQEVLRHNRNCNIIRPKTGQLCRLAADEKIHILDLPAGEASGNDAGIVAAVECEGHRILFPGDISAQREEQLQDVGHCEVLKVAHHGSGGSSSEEFLRQVRPEIAVISAGSGNSYGHPHPETLHRLQEVNAAVLRTDWMGAVKIVFDDEGTKCYSYVYHKQYF